MAGIIVTLLLVVGLLALAQGIWSLATGVQFLRFVRDDLRRRPSGYAPPAVVFLPCKGIDTRLADTLRAVRAQDYPDYEVICAVESAHDPAAGLIERCACEAGGAPMRLVVANHADGCAQKIANLLAALEQVPPRAEVYAFLDSDALPHARWLAELVGPLADPAVGAVTGYRWYVPRRSWASRLRCVWNGSTLTVMGPHERNFCWGGSTAIRRATFEGRDIAGRWRRALAEDSEITRGVRSAGLRIHFAPRCVLPSDDEVTFAGLWQFARRQIIITRICNGKVWLAGLIMAAIFVTAFWGSLVAGLSGVLAAPRGGLLQGAAPFLLGLAAVLYGLAIAKGVVRQRAVALLLPDPRLRGGAVLLDVLGAPLIALFTLALLAAAGVSNRFWWRGVHYEMNSMEDTRILARAT